MHFVCFTAETKSNLVRQIFWPQQHRIKTMSVQTISCKLCSTKIKRPDISYVPLRQWREVQLPLWFKSYYFPRICPFVTFLFSIQYNQSRRVYI